MKISVVIPVYNEEKTIREIVSRVEKVKIDKEIILVDDGSTDQSKKIISQLGKKKNIHALFHFKNQGKGAALRSGFKKAKGEIIIIQDADLEYNPQDYHKLIEPIEKGQADVVYGSRFLGEPHRSLFFWHYLGNRLLTFFSNMLNNLNLSDMETCYKAFRRQILKRIKIKSNRFGFEPEFTAKVAKNGFRIYEVAIQYNGRTYREGKKITWKDGVKAFFTIIWFRFFD